MLYKHTHTPPPPPPPKKKNTMGESDVVIRPVLYCWCASSVISSKEFGTQIHLDPPPPSTHTHRRTTCFVQPLPFSSPPSNPVLSSLPARTCLLRHIGPTFLDDDEHRSPLPCLTFFGERWGFPVDVWGPCTSPGGLWRGEVGATVTERHSDKRNHPSTP